MYKVEFQIGNNDRIQCIVNGQKQNEDLVLNSKGLFNILNKLITEYKAIEELDRDFSYITFNNVDEQEFEDYLNQEYSKGNYEQKQIAEKKMKSRTAQTQKQKPVKKVKRKNKFKRTIISLSLATSMALTAIAAIKGNDTLNPAYEDTNNNPSIEDSITADNNETYDNYEYKEYDEKDNETYNYKENEENNNIDYEEIIDLDIEENTQNEKYLYCKNNYGEIITKYANIYGIDPNLAIAVFTHERGYHSDVMDPGGAIGLCQVQLDVWDNQDITAYNFENKNWETYHIKEENVKNLEENIKAGVMILQDSLRQVSYVVFQGVQNYNYGLGNLNVAFKNSGLNSQELNEQNRKEWMQYRDLIRGGDPLYVEHVFQYIPSDTTLHFKTPGGQEINLHYVAQRNLSR